MSLPALRRRISGLFCPVLPLFHASAESEQGGSVRGILLMLGAMAAFSVMDGISKATAVALPPLEVIWGRYLFHNLLLLLLISGRHRGLTLPRSRRPWAQLGRGVLLTGSGVLFLAGLTRLPMAEATAIGLVAPLMVTAFSVYLLGERVGPGRWFAVAVGFAGVLVVVRPGTAAFDPAALMPLGAALCWALSLILTRGIGRDDPPLTTAVWTAGVGLAVISLIVPWSWSVPEPSAWAAFFALGLVAALGQYLTIVAFLHADASVLAPFQYSQIVWSSLIGLFVFQNIPDVRVLLGAVLIVGGGLSVWRAERRARSRP